MNEKLKYFGYLFFIPIWWLQLVIPRNKNIWIFGAWYGNRFSDNSKYLYSYVQKNYPHIKVIWLTRKVSVRNQINKEGGKCYLANSLQGIYYSLLAKYVFVSSGKRDVNYLFINGARWVQLWHGNPLKKIGLDDRFSRVHTFFHKKLVPVLFPFVCEFNYNLVVSNSKAFSDKMASSFNMPISKILETGCPRNDAFFMTPSDEFNNDLRAKYKGCKLVYYLPTFRSHSGSKSLFTLEDYDSEKIESFLEKENIVFVSKGHYVDNKLGTETTAQGRIVNLSDENIVNDINFMLKDADLLITDYSAAYFDFLLTEKPIIFAAFDLEEYLNSSREMYFDYKQTIAGPIARNWKELMENLQNVWSNQKYMKLVKEKNKEFNKYHDANNSKRVFDSLIKK